MTAVANYSVITNVC